MYDTLIRGGMIIDGSGKPATVADVGIKDGRIRAIGPDIDGEATHVVDARGFMVTPGFIDVHAHDDLAILHDEGLPYKLLQGVTTTIVGNCGHSVAPVPVASDLREALRAYVEPVLGKWSGSADPFGYNEVRDYYDAIRSTPQAVNVAALVGHGPLRIRVMGFSDLPASPSEIADMQQLLAAAMEEGALGLSLGLMYAPGCFARPEELMALATTVKQHGGIVTSHIRGEGDFLLPSIHEMLDIAQQVHVPMHISHLKVVGRHNWGSVNDAIALIRTARERGLDITCDGYPYSAGSTTILSLLPPWVLQGGVDGALERLRDATARERIGQDLAAQGEGWENVAYITGWERIVLTSSALLPEYEGLDYVSIADRMGCDVTEAYLRTIEQGQGQGTIVVHHMAESDVGQVMKFEYAAVGSDGLPSDFGHPHPRLYGTFPRFLSKYVREQNLLELPAGIYKITCFAANRFGLEDRGRLEVGARADVVVFDYDSLSDRATYEHPRQFAEGIAHVFVNGVHAVRDASATGAAAGQLLPRSGAAPSSY